MLKLQPIKDKDIYHEAIYHEIMALLDEILFNPILKIARTQLLTNASSSVLIGMLQRGEISYGADYFTGKFNAAVGKELRDLGASWNKLRKAYYLPSSDVPTNIKIAIAKSQSILQEKVAKINERLDYLHTTGSIETINFSGKFSGIMLDIDKQFRNTTPTEIGIPLTLTDFMKESIDEEYTNNLNRDIQDMTIKTTLRLREKVFDNVAQGYRSSRLAEIIEAEHGVAQRHAKFLARQETSLLVAAYRDSRYKQASINEWVWSSSHDSRVRPLHRELDGTKWSYSNLPVIDERTGEKGTPGVAYGCRCRMIPLLDTDKYNPKTKKIG